MEVKLDMMPLCAALASGNRIAIGFVDGSLTLSRFSRTSKNLELLWKFQLKASVRSLAFSNDESQLYAVSSNRGLSAFDTETGCRVRCIVQSHKKRPTTICALQPGAFKHTLATGDEAGNIHTWDLKAETPLICKWKEQEGDINAFALDHRHNLLSASGDGTLAAFEVRKHKLRVKSEMMHSELQCICVTNQYVYAGGGEGYIEVFKQGEYGNILERIDTKLKFNVDQIVELRNGLLLVSSGTSNKLSMVNVNPTKRMGNVGTHGEEDDGVDLLLTTADKKTLISMVMMAQTLKIWPLDELLEDVPIVRADNIPKRKGPVVKDGFFDDLVDKKRRRHDKDSDDEDDSDEEDESGSDEEGEEESDDEENGAGDEGDSDEDDDDNDEEEDGEDEDEEEESDDEEVPVPVAKRPNSKAHAILNRKRRF